MADPPAAVQPERDALLATKLHVPGPRPGLVPAPAAGGARSTRAWRTGWSWSAPRPGTARRSCWPTGPGAASGPWRWLSLDAGDNDPARFWRHAVAALDRVRPGLAERVGPLLGPPAPASFEPLVTALINELAAGAARR